MTAKKVIIIVLAIVAIGAAIYGVWEWQQKASNQPSRQEEEIR